MTTRLLLLRHAAHDLAGKALAGRLPGLTINAAGREQARRLADALAGHGIGAIHSSPQPRTRDTAAPLAQRLGLAVQLAPEFDEIDFGHWTGRAFAELQGPEWTQWVERRSQACPPGGEAFRAVRERTAAGVERLRRDHPGRCVLVVSHADVIKCVIATHLRMSLDDLECFDIGCAGLCVLDVGEGWSQVKAVNVALVG